MTDRLKSSQDIQRIETKDGSTSLYSLTYDQPYHNPNGAVSESRHVFLDPAPVSSKLQSGSPLTVFETGFGTGLNLLLLMDKLADSTTNTPLSYHTVEARLISARLLRTAGFESFLNQPVLVDKLAAGIDRCTHGSNTFAITQRFEVTIFHGYFNDISIHDNSVDIFFHDPFSIQVNPELWTLETFKKMYRWGRDEAVLTTYAAASKARAAMAEAGWYVARAPGALGKREMTIAAKKTALLADYKRVNEQRLAERLRRGDFN